MVVNEDYYDEFSAPVGFLSYIPASPAFPSLYSVAYMNWKLGDNPFGRSAAHLRHVDGAAAAHCSVTAKPPNDALCGTARLAELGDTHTHPDFQKRGHFGAIGQHAIAAFSQADMRPALIYGLPNQNALPGWLRHCGCKVIETMGVKEMLLGPRAALMQRVSGLLPGSDSIAVSWTAPDTEIEAVIDKVWATARSTGWLVRKDAAWWRWRYRHSTETYRTGLVMADGEAQGWIVVKRVRTRWPLVTRVAVCDVVATSPALEVAAFRRIVRGTALPSPVTIWAQAGQPIHDAALRMGFQEVRAVPVIVVENEAAAALRNTGVIPRLCLGDTDNV